MATAAPEIQRRGAAGPPKPADVLVVFGITGDLAKVMTFRSLYRLEQRGLLDCPIVGVAVDDWTVDQLRDRARESIVGDGRAARRGGLRALRRAAFLRRGRLRRRGDLRARRATRSRARSSRSSTWRSRRSCSATVVKGLSEAGLTKNARVVVEKPFGHDLASAGELADELHQYIDESQLYRIDHYLGKMGLEEILHLRFANTMLEPIWNRNYVSQRADHDGGGLRRRGPRPLLRSGRGAARRRRQPPDAGRRRLRRWRRPSRGDPGTIKDAQVALFQLGRRGGSGALRARAVRRLPLDRRRRRRLDDRDVRGRCGSRSRTGAGPACRSSSAPASACRRRRPSCGSCFKQPPRLGFGARRPQPRAEPARRQARPVDGHPDRSSTPIGPTAAGTAASSSTWSSPRRAARGRRPTRCCCTPRCVGDSTRFTRQDGVEETWRVMQPLLDAPPPVHPYAAGDAGGLRRPNELVAGHGRWHGPWITS